MKNFNHFNKFIVFTLATAMTLVTLSTSVAFAATNQNSNKEKLVSQVQQLLTDAEKVGVKVNKDGSNKGIDSLNEQELKDMWALLNFAITNHTKVKDNATSKLKKNNSIVANSINDSKGSIEIMGSGSSSTYVCRAGIKYTSISGTVPVDGKTKSVSTNVSVYARWAYLEVINGYTGTESNTFYKASQYYASTGTTISLGTIKSFSQNTIGVERATSSGFYIVGTGTYKINYAGLIIDFFVPFSQQFSIFDGAYQYSSTTAPF